MLTRNVIVLSAPCYYYFTAYEDQWIIWSRLILWRHYDATMTSFLTHSNDSSVFQSESKMPSFGETLSKANWSLISQSWSFYDSLTMTHCLWVIMSSEIVVMSHHRTFPFKNWFMASSNPFYLFLDFWFNRLNVT